MARGRGSRGRDRGRGGARDPAQTRRAGGDRLVRAHLVQPLRRGDRLLLLRDQPDPATRGPTGRPPPGAGRGRPRSGRTPEASHPARRRARPAEPHGREGNRQPAPGGQRRSVTGQRRRSLSGDAGSHRACRAERPADYLHLRRRPSGPTVRGRAVRRRGPGRRGPRSRGCGRQAVQPAADHARPESEERPDGGVSAITRAFS